MEPIDVVRDCVDTVRLLRHELQMSQEKLDSLASCLFEEMKAARLLRDQVSQLIPYLLF